LRLPEGEQPLSARRRKGPESTTVFRAQVGHVLVDLSGYIAALLTLPAHNAGAVSDSTLVAIWL
jgi:hypothetical protein